MGNLITRDPIQRQPPAVQNVNAGALGGDPYAEYRARAQVFNKDPASALPMSISPETMAGFLRYHPFLSPEAVGVHLAAHPQVLAAYVCTFDTAALPYLAALRMYLESFSPVKDARTTDRYIDAWCAHYLQTNTHPDREIFASQNAVFTLTYSIAMLNVDLHSPVLAGRPRITLEQYVTNMEDLNEGKKFPRAFLEAIYNEIRDREIMLHRE